jgi:uncharacterized protein YdhG (YjbR/CyaY superfamily)
MRTKTRPPTDIDSYIAGFPREIRARLETVRAAVRRAAPQAQEKISYRMPAYALCGSLVWFAAFENHIGFYPGASGVKKFAREFRSYAHAKGSVQFPHDQPIPSALIAEVVAFRVAENLARWAAKGGEKPRAPRRPRPRVR